MLSDYKVLQSAKITKLYEIHHALSQLICVFKTSKLTLEYYTYILDKTYE